MPFGLCDEMEMEGVATDTVEKAGRVEMRAGAGCETGRLAAGGSGEETGSGNGAAVANCGAASRACRVVGSPRGARKWTSTSVTSAMFAASEAIRILERRGDFIL
jgi:hypothetical protein